LLDRAHRLIPRPAADGLLELGVEETDGQVVAAVHLLYRIFELLLKLLSLDLALSLLLTLLVYQLFLKCSPLMSLFLKPGLLLDNHLLLAILQVLLALDVLNVLELFSECVRLRILSLINEALEHFLVLQQGSARLEPEGFVKLELIVLPQLQKHRHVGLLKSFQVSLA